MDSTDMKGHSGPNRRRFLESVAVATGLGSPAQAPSAEVALQAKAPKAGTPHGMEYPRKFTGPALSMISFPLGGVGAGSIGLGGRGQLRDWEIFNRPDRGNTPDYAFASIWVKPEGGKAIARVLESRINPP